MFISPRVELGGSKDCHLLKYYNVRKWESRFTLGLDAAENTHYIQKCFKCRKLHLRGLLMFSNVFEELSVSLSAVVNSFKVTNLCKNGIRILKIWRGAIFWFKIWQNFTSSSNFMIIQKLEPSVPNIFILHLKMQKQNS